MADVVIAEGLSKCFHIHAREAEPAPLGRRLAAAATAPFRAVARRMRGEHRPAEDPGLFWALRDLSFRIAEGDVVGIIGHNGAGKSTLLKILARITPPTLGTVRARGQMASLLEVGTGFHPELSGRDNVYMNAAILGMSRKQIRRRFDAIVDFSGVEEFIDTPIKRYSSGMKVRLAFSVAAHLDPDILVIDEVLAVGDADFQKKCLGRIEEVGASGRTILFVSHQLTTVARLCRRGIVLDHGRIVFDGSALEAIRDYNDRLGTARSRRVWQEPEPIPRSEDVELHSVEVLDGGQLAAGPLDVRRPIDIRLRYRVVRSVQVTPSVHLFDTGGTWIFASLDVEPESLARPRPPGDYESIARIPANLLNETTYIVTVGLATLEPFQAHCFVHDCVSFTVFDPMQGDTARGTFRGEIPGAIRPQLEWTTARA